MEKIVFIRYIVSAKNIEKNKKNVKIIQEWPKPISTIKIKSFRGLTNYSKLIIIHIDRLALAN
jgi:hypothetical protein